MQLDLTTSLLRHGVDPIRAISSTSREYVQFALWSAGGPAWFQPGDLDERELLDAAMPGDVVIAIIRRPAEAPQWQSFLEEALPLPGFSTDSTSRGAIIFCAVEDATDQQTIRWVAWSFGAGSRIIQRFKTVPRFGLLIALNALALGSDPPAGDSPQARHERPSLLDLQYRTTTPYRQRTEHRAPRALPVQGFRIDQQIDLVSAVGGRSADPMLSKVLGGRSLSFPGRVERIEDLVTYAEQLVARSQSDDYRQAFAWVDNIVVIDDADLLQLLRQRLAHDLLADPVPPHIDVVLPGDLPDGSQERPVRYILLPGERRERANQTILVPAMVSRLVAAQNGSACPDKALDLRLRFLDEDHDTVMEATVLECLCAELTVDGEQYVTCDGDFYRVNRAHAAAIDEELRGSLLPESQVCLPPYGGEPEPSYNQRVGREHPDQFVVLDTTLLRTTGESGIEPCDLFAVSGALIHVKRKARSRELSYLFLQAANSAELLRRSPEARKQLRLLIEEHARIEYERRCCAQDARQPRPGRRRAGGPLRAAW